MTQTSKSKTRRVAAIGNGCVIPAQAGIHVASVNGQWVPAFAGMTIRGGTGRLRFVTHPSKSKTRRVTAIGNGCVIPAHVGNCAGIHVASVNGQWARVYRGAGARINDRIAS